MGGTDSKSVGEKLKFQNSAAPASPPATARSFLSAPRSLSIAILTVVFILPLPSLFDSIEQYQLPGGAQGQVFWGINFPSCPPISDRLIPMSVSESLRDELEFLRGYELRLLRCTFPPQPSDAQDDSPLSCQNQHIHVLIDQLLNSIEAGNYQGALTSDGVRQAFGLSATGWADSVDSADNVYSELQERVERFLVHDSADEVDRVHRAILVMSVAIAALFEFSQCNMTGPLKELPRCPLPSEAGNKNNEYREWDNWACNQLMSAGSDLLGKFCHLQYIVYAKILLMKIRDLLSQGHISSSDSLQSISWWLARVILLQQRIMDERSSFLFDLLQVFMGESLYNFGTLERVSSYWGSKLFKEEISAIVSMVHLEAGIGEYTYGRTDSCRKKFDSAEMAAGLQLSVTGVLGFRTANQVNNFKFALCDCCYQVSYESYIDDEITGPVLGGSQGTEGTQYKWKLIR
ncbi:hypothetical protein CRG98_035208 [Punica granatum]|uniref:Uncharacterized protein n=1 Tax=Punica granatum TaxID=22663 RepID=A0A2I0IK74_PUNGR|nr:hypothetical protein CRG98_035208 [Punica granatum]